jgi:hypothetical protein
VYSRTKIASYQLRKFVLLWLCVAGMADGSPETQPLPRRVGWGLNIFCVNFFFFCGSWKFGNIQNQTEKGTLCLSITKKRKFTSGKWKVRRTVPIVTIVFIFKFHRNVKLWNEFYFTTLRHLVEISTPNTVITHNHGWVPAPLTGTPKFRNCQNSQNIKSVSIQMDKFLKGWNYFFQVSKLILVVNVYMADVINYLHIVQVEMRGGV